MTASQTQRLVDYFVVCGLDLNSGLEPDLLSGDSLHCTPLERPYKSKVLCHFPENVQWNPFDANAIGMLCLPKGLQFRTQRQALDPRFHTFIITKEDGSRTYGFAYTYFEEVTSRPICVAMQTLQAMHKAELSHRHSKTLRAGGHDPYGGNTRSLPRSFRLTSVEQCQHFAQINNSVYYDLLADKLYVTKCVGLVGQVPFLYACRCFLQYLYKFISSNEPPQLHLESYIRHILYEVSIPPPGCSASFSCFGHQIIFQRPAISELPIFEYSLRDVLLLLGLENLINVFTCLLLENQILLYSHDYHRLMLVAESVSVLLFPFIWQHVYVPILPASLLHFLDAPVPFVMGLQWDSMCRTSPPVTGEANLCYVDIDNGTVELPEDLPTFPHRLELLQELSEQVALRGVSIQQKQITNQPERIVSTHTKYRRKKMSWGAGGYDSDSGSADHRQKPNSDYHNRQDILQRSKAMQRVTEIAKRTGVITGNEEHRPNLRLEGNNNVQTQFSARLQPSDTKSHKEELLFNNCIREIFLNRFTHLFISYEYFVIQPNQDMEQWLSFRETVHNFDKAAFLSDQPEPHLPFLSRFIETQMFVSLIDNKILSQWELPDPYLAIFDRRIKVLRETYGESLVRTPSYECCTTIASTEELIEKRLDSLEFIGSPPKPVDLPNNPRIHHKSGFLPHLDAAVLNRQPLANRHQRRGGSQQGKRKELAEKYLQESRNKNSRQPVLSEMSAAVIAQTNWKFVETLLRECKNKTKRMLVEKMGVEAVELGHGELSLNGVEENTLIASLCDLLERVWSHGLQTKEGKSALWSHLLRYQKAEESKTLRTSESKLLMVPVCSVRTPASIPDLLLSVRAGALGTVAAHLANFDIASAVNEMDATFRRGLGEGNESSKSKREEGSAYSSLKPLPVSLTFDMRNVQAMDDIRSEIGYARAWIRISLEKKLLSKHLKTLLAETETLRGLYKRYAFLRCEDEKEQFLYHLLSLNAVDYYCFSNTFTSTIITYRTIIFPSRKSGAATSANVWVCLSGSLGETGIIPIPKTFELVFRHQNLGILTTLRIGHDNSGISPKWMVEHVIVRNEVTSHTYKFPCGRWLGKGIDDGSTERLLVGELIPLTADNEELMETCRTPPRCRSPNIPKKFPRARLTAGEIQQLLADAVNSIIKHYYKPEKERGSLTILLCGEMGLVTCLERVFLYGFKSTRLFGRHLYLWDFFVKVQSYFENEFLFDSNNCSTESSKDKHQVKIVRSYCKLVSEVNQSSHTVGKDGRFQLFVCLATRDHLLHRIPLHVASTPVTTQMYEEYSFLRDPTLMTFLIKITESLQDFPFHLEASLTQSISPRAK